MILRKTPLKRSQKPIRRSRVVRGPQAPIERKSRPATQRRSEAGKKRRSVHAEWRKLIMSMSDRCLIGKPGVCSGKATDACHLLPKGAYPALKDCPTNGVPGCRGCHDYYTRHKQEWLDWIEENVSVRARTSLWRGVGVKFNWLVYIRGWDGESLRRYLMGR